MLNEEIIKSMLNLYNNFLFRKCFVDFFRKMQLDGIKSARKFWELYPYKNIFPSHTSDMFEKMINFYVNLGLVPKEQYDALLKEHEKLQLINTFLRETFMQLQLKIFEESGEKMREEWKIVIERQMAVNKEIAKDFSKLFSQSGTCFHEKEERPSNAHERRHEIRRMCNYPVEFVLDNAEDKPLEGIILNISDSGLCMNASVPLKRGQKITIKGFLPMRHQAFTVQWSDALTTGLSI